MKASIVDLRRRTKEILRALDRGETVTVLYRGRKKGVLRPVQDRKRRLASVIEHPAFGIWKGRNDLKDVAKAVRTIRRGRGHAV